jgi:hypothetical protein
MQASKAGVSSFQRSVARGFSCVVLAFAVVGCGDDSEPKEAEIDLPRVWVGEVADSDVRVGLTFEDGRTNVFFCGGARSLATSTRWFSGDALLDDGLSFTEAGWSVNASVDGSSVVGTVEPGGTGALDWVAREIAPETSAGLYEGEAPCGKLGLIVTQASKDDEPSGQGACMGIEGETLIVEQVNPVFERISELEIPVTVESLPGDEFTVRPVVAVAR